ncbi:hypothetical protein [Thermostilla marina]
MIRPVGLCGICGVCGGSAGVSTSTPGITAGIVRIGGKRDVDYKRQVSPFGNTLPAGNSSARPFVRGW